MCRPTALGYDVNGYWRIQVGPIAANKVEYLELLFAINGLQVVRRFLFIMRCRQTALPATTTTNTLVVRALKLQRAAAIIVEPDERWPI